MKFSHQRSSWVIVRRALSLIVLVSELSAQVGERHVRLGFPQDWSHRHVIFNRSIISAHPELANIEPRVLHQFLREMPRSPVTEAAPSNKQAHLKRDWMVAEIAASVAAGMSPAKFGFDASTTNCANDYVVFGLNALGVTEGQGNLVALNNLYSGPSGLCGTGGPSLLFSYNTTTAGGRVKTSPVLSLDGTKIAFVESGTGVSVFHVLTWANGSGQWNFGEGFGYSWRGQYRLHDLADLRRYRERHVVVPMGRLHRRCRLRRGSGAEGTDFFFWGMTQDCPTAAGVPGVASGCVMSLTNFGAVTTVTEAGGTSVVITDNFSTAGQASSIYFTNFANPHNAVKLTQNGLN